MEDFTALSFMRRQKPIFIVITKIFTIALSYQIRTLITIVSAATRATAFTGILMNN
jgi:hypothetical protein